MRMHPSYTTIYQAIITSIYRHMTVYDGICRDIRVSGFQMRRSYFPCPMTAQQNARIKTSVGAAFYSCCFISRALGSEGLASWLKSIGNHRELSIGTCLTEAGIEHGRLASELSEERRSPRYFPCPMTARQNALIKQCRCCLLSMLRIQVGRALFSLDPISGNSRYLL